MYNTKRRVRGGMLHYPGIWFLQVWYGERPNIMFPAVSVDLPGSYLTLEAANQRAMVMSMMLDGARVGPAHCAGGGDMGLVCQWQDGKVVHPVA